MSRLAVGRLPLVLREVVVTRVADVTPRLRRVTLTGPQLASFPLRESRNPDSTEVEAHGDEPLAAFATPSFDDHVKCIFTDAPDADLPAQHLDGIAWPPSGLSRARDYTPTRFDPDTREVDLEFVLHGHGPAATWARNASPGAILHLVGPRATTPLPEGLDWILLVGDETAIPAIFRFARERPTPARAIILISVADASAEVALDVRDDDVVRWIVGDPADADGLRDAVAEIIPTTGRGFAWAAGESRTLLPLRRLVKDAPALSEADVNITGYWHSSTVAADDH